MYVCDKIKEKLPVTIIYYTASKSGDTKLSKRSSKIFHKWMAR